MEAAVDNRLYILPLVRPFYQVMDGDSYTYGGMGQLAQWGLVNLLDFIFRPSCPGYLGGSRIFQDSRDSG